MKAWLAFWMDGKTRRSKTFSSKQLGFESARLAAIEFLHGRREGLLPASPSSSQRSLEQLALPGSPTGEKTGPYSTRSNTSVSTTNSRTSLSSVTTNMVEIAGRGL